MKTITLTEQDLILAYKLNIFKNPSYPKFRALFPWRWPLILIGILCICIYIYLNKYTCYEFTILSIYIIGLIFFLVGFLVALTPFLTIRRAKRAWKKSKLLHDPYTVIWNQNDLFINSDHQESRIKWNSYCKAVQDENYILAYYQQNLFLMIPKRFFENEPEMKDFLNHLEVGIKENKENNQ